MRHRAGVLLRTFLIGAQDLRDIGPQSLLQLGNRLLTVLEPIDGPVQLHQYIENVWCFWRGWRLEEAADQGLFVVSAA
ncbi:hypothetical protein D3C86_2022640 [compost metagenome]